MNLAEITIRRLNEEAEKKVSKVKPDDQPKLPEPVKDVREFIKENINFEKPSEEFISNDSEKNDHRVVNNCIELSEIFRESEHGLTKPQKQAFDGIEMLREYLLSKNCNCQDRINKINEYYKDFILGNAKTDLFSSIKNSIEADSITFIYEGKEIHKI